MFNSKMLAIAAVAVAPMAFADAARAQSAQQIAPGVVFNTALCVEAANTEDAAQACCGVDSVETLNRVLGDRQCGFLRRFFARYVTRRDPGYETPRGGGEQCEGYQCDREGGGDGDGGGQSGGGGRSGGGGQSGGGQSGGQSSP